MSDDGMTVHAIPADFESEHGRDVEKTTEAAKASPRLESNVTAPAGYKPEHGAIETADADSRGVETASIPLSK